MSHHYDQTDYTLPERHRARIAELERELAEAREDAERYRHIRECRYIDVASVWILPTGESCRGADLNAAIDAARKGEK